jgi:hypothetical protein
LAGSGKLGDERAADDKTRDVLLLFGIEDDLHLGEPVLARGHLGGGNVKDLHCGPKVV